MTAVRALGEVALRVTDLARSQAFYRDVIGLDVMKRFDHAIFLRVADGYAGHTAILALFDRKVPVEQTRTTRDHIAFTIAREDYEAAQRQWTLRLRSGPNKRTGHNPCATAG